MCVELGHFNSIKNTDRGVPVGVMNGAGESGILGRWRKICDE